MLGSMPLPGGKDAKILKDLGVTAIVNLCKEFKGPIHEYKLHHIYQYYVPCCDIIEPNLIAVLTAVKYIRDFVNKHPNEKIFVHCKGGRGRSVSVVLSYLLTIGYNVDDAMELIRSKRNVVDQSVKDYSAVKTLQEAIDAGGSFDTVYSTYLKDSKR